MTKLMEQAIEKLRALPEDAQDSIAGFILFELEDNRRWEQSSIKHVANLRKLADEAVRDFHAGRTS